MSGHASRPTSAGALSPKKVLVVDDEPTLVATLKYNLEPEGYQVISASDGAPALSTPRGRPPLRPADAPPAAEREVVSAGDLQVDMRSRQASLHGEALALKPKEY